jgi:hypothetical protein
VSNVLRLTLLAPDIVEAILGRTEVPGPNGAAEQDAAISTTSPLASNRLNLERLLLLFRVERVVGGLMWPLAPLKGTGNDPDRT